MMEEIMLQTLRTEVQYRPADRHPSDWVPLETKEPPKWALEEFKMLPNTLTDLATSDFRSPLVPSSFKSHVTPLEKAYLSIENRDFIMERILSVMLRVHKVRLTRQSDVALLGVMTNVYEENVRDLQAVTPARLLIAVATLNALVLERSVLIMTREYRDYVRDRKYFEKAPTWVSDMPLPQNTSIKNENPLASQPTFMTKFPLPRPDGISDDSLASVGSWPS